MIERASGLKTDLYELTMAAAYFENGAHNQRGIFELFVRSLPRNRSYLIAAGLEQALDYLESLSFTQQQLDYLRSHPSFKHVSAEFFDYLGSLKFTGDVWAVPEGTAVFGQEPLLRIEAPIVEAQIVETFLLATINFQTSIASKAARIVTAATGAAVIEFGTRRAHGSEAGLFAARAAFIGGCAGTSNVEAGYLFALPIFGTLAHSFIMSFDDEDEAFRAFLRVFPDTATILVDTYDSIAAVERLAHNFDKRIAAVRLDSGDLLELSRHARQTLDEGGMNGTRIFASGDLDEYRIAELLAANAPIDSFGVGTQLATSYDAPALGGVYKLVGLNVDGNKKMRMKLSTGKATYPGAKQIWRLVDEQGGYVEDILSLIDEPQPQRSGLMAKPLLEPVMKAGRAIEVSADNDAVREGRLSRLISARARAKEELSRLPGELLALDAQPLYRVKIGEGLAAATRKLSGAR